jgi:uncharacterized protein
VDIKQLDLVIKPTLLCNARCIYCHSLKPSTILSRGMLRELIVKYGEYTKKRGFAKGYIYWHGGEPMLPGEAFYSYFLELKEKYLSHMEIENGMQSNVCLYKNATTREIVSRVLTDRHINACIDPFHPTRFLKNGESYLKDALQSLRLLRKDGFHIGMVYVIHKKSLEVVNQTYYYFKNIGVGDVLYHPLEEFDDEEYKLTPEDLGEYFKKLWEVWEADGYAMPIAPLEDWYVYLAQGRPVNMCEYCVRPPEIRSITVSPEGDLYPCPRYQDRDAHRIGNIAEMSFDDALAHPSSRIITTIKENQPPECKMCDFQNMCNSGCVITHDKTGKTQWCEGLKSFFRFLTSRKTIPITRDLKPTQREC